MILTNEKVQQTYNTSNKKKYSPSIILAISNK